MCLLLVCLGKLGEVGKCMVGRQSLSENSISNRICLLPQFSFVGGDKVVRSSHTRLFSLSPWQLFVNVCLMCAATAAAAAVVVVRLHCL